MLSDMVKIGSIVLCMQPAFVCAERILFRNIDDAESCGLSDLSLFDHFVALNEIFIGESNISLECLRNSPQGYWAWSLHFLFTTITVLMLLNMLIAALTKTYDTITDSLDISYAFVRAALVDNVCRTSVAPAPLNLFAVPARLLYFLADTYRKRAHEIPRDCKNNLVVKESGLEAQLVNCDKESSLEVPPIAEDEQRHLELKPVTEEMLDEHSESRSSESHVGDSRWRLLFMRRLDMSCKMVDGVTADVHALRQLIEERLPDPRSGGFAVEQAFADIPRGPTTGLEGNAR
jgi:hypothetical protein